MYSIDKGRGGGGVQIWGKKYHERVDVHDERDKYHVYFFIEINMINKQDVIFKLKQREIK